MEDGWEVSRPINDEGELDFHEKFKADPWLHTKRQGKRFIGTIYEPIRGHEDSTTSKRAQSCILLHTVLQLAPHTQKPKTLCMKAQWRGACETHCHVGFGKIRYLLYKSEKTQQPTRKRRKRKSFLFSFIQQSPALPKDKKTLVTRYSSQTLIHNLGCGKRNSVQRDMHVSKLRKASTVI